MKPFQMGRLFSLLAIPAYPQRGRGPDALATAMWLVDQCLYRLVVAMWLGCSPAAGFRPSAEGRVTFSCLPKRK